MSRLLGGIWPYSWLCHLVGHKWYLHPVVGARVCKRCCEWGATFSQDQRKALEDGAYAADILGGEPDVDQGGIYEEFRRAAATIRRMLGGSR